MKKIWKSLRVASGELLILKGESTFCELHLRFSMFLEERVDEPFVIILCTSYSTCVHFWRKMNVKGGKEVCLWKIARAYLLLEDPNR